MENRVEGSEGEYDTEEERGEWGGRMGEGIGGGGGPLGLINWGRGRMSRELEEERGEN